MKTSRTWIDKRTALDPDDYVRRISATYADDPRGYHFSIAYFDGTTPTGRIRYGLRITIDDPDFYDRARAAASPRLGHCTGTFAGHSPACDRDGTYCSLASTHSGPCKPHGGARGAS